MAPLLQSSTAERDAGACTACACARAYVPRGPITNGLNACESTTAYCAKPKKLEVASACHKVGERRAYYWHDSLNGS